MSVTISVVGRRALITGGGQGVGRGLALAFAAAGAEVVVNDLHADRAHAVIAEICQRGGQGLAASFDVTDYSATMAEIERHGPIDILVNNAGNAGGQGFPPRKLFAESTPQDWEPFLRVNLYGVMNCTRAVLPMMSANGWGRIVTILSDAGRTGQKYAAAYSAAKAAAGGLTRSVALEAGRYGVTANNIALGTMLTPATESLWAERSESPQAQAILRNYVLRRPGTSDDVSHLAVLLASDHGGWITGQTILVNGGYSFSL